MKKFILPILSISLICGCSKINSSSPQQATVSFSVNLSESGTAVKATADSDGAGEKVNRCVLQIWLDGKIYRTVTNTIGASAAKQFYFSGLPLLADQTYDFLFWADSGDDTGNDLYYSTSSLRNVSLVSKTICNSDSLDAFCGSILAYKVEKDFSESITLKRPLSQLNLIADDYSALEGSGSDFIPTKVSCSYKGRTGIDVATGNYCGEYETITVNAGNVYNLTTTGTFAMAYLFPNDSSDVTPVSFKMSYAGGSSVSSTFENIPFKTNYRTNVRGSLFTRKGSFSVTLDKDWNSPEINK